MKMANLQKSVLLLLAIAVALCSAEPPRYRQRIVKFQQQRRPFLARQEAAPAAPAAPAPYPSADDLKPAVPFEEGVQPDQTYGPPDQTYGPPEQTYGPPAAAPGGGSQLPSAETPQQFAPNPDAEEFLPIVQPARFIRRRPEKQRVAQLQPQLLSQPLPQVQPQPQIIVKAAPAAVAPLQVALASLPLQQYSYYVINQPYAYSAQFQTW